MNHHKFINATNILVVSCVIAFVIVNQWVGIGASGFELFYWESPSFRPIQLLSHMFLHGGLMHLLLNMLGLWMFGTVVERTLGAKSFLLFYFICGLGAAAIYEAVNYYQYQEAITPLLEAGMSQKTLLETFSAGQYYIQFPSSEQASIIFNSPVIGASGALYGVLVAFACLFPNHKIMLIFLPVPIAAKFFVPALLCFDLFSGVTGIAIFGSNIAHAAHIGGAITGILLMLLLFLQRRKQNADYF